MYKKHELIIGFKKKKMKMAESSRALSLNKKKVKRYFLVISSNVQISAKYEVWKILLRGKYCFLYYFTDFLQSQFNCEIL